VSRADVRLSDRALPSWDGVLPPWPGEQQGGVFVRRGPQTGAEPALFVHGLGGASTNWTDLMGLLADEVDAAALDLPGFGWSEPPVGPAYPLRVHVRAVVETIERWDRGPVHLLGNSLGGAVSTRVAARRPDLVKTLTLVSPALPNLRVSKGVDPRLALLAVPGLAQLVTRRLAATTPEQRVRAVLELCYGDPREIQPERAAEAVEEFTRRRGLAHSQEALTLSLKGLVATYFERGPRNLWEQARSVQAETLIVWGTADRLVSVRVAPRALAAFPHSRLLVLPGVGHVAQMERPETVARAFLALKEDTEPHRATDPR
jgi:pimeloyl-ACP methyl ester carboxylesterase